MWLEGNKGAGEVWAARPMPTDAAKRCGAVRPGEARRREGRREEGEISKIKPGADARHCLGCLDDERGNGYVL